MMKNKLAILAVAAVLFCGNALASGGSGSSGGSSGSGGATSSNSGSSSGLDSSYQGKYDLGKRLLKTRLLCTNCPLAGTDLDDEGAKLIIKRLKYDNELATVLSEEDFKALEYYLNERFL